MNKETYLEALKREIAALPADEQESALQYYADYFDDAGSENEQKVIAELGSPAELGAFIRSRFSCVPAEIPAKAKEKSEAKSSYKKFERQSGETKSRNIVLVVLLLLLTIPLWGPVFFSILGIGIGAIAVILSLGFAGLIAGAAVLGTGIVLIISSFIHFAYSPINAVLSLGAGVLVLGLGLVIGVFGLWFCTKALPAIIRFIVSLFRRPINKRSSV